MVDGPLPILGGPFVHSPWPGRSKRSVAGVNEFLSPNDAGSSRGLDSRTIRVIRRRRRILQAFYRGHIQGSHGAGRIVLVGKEMALSLSPTFTRSRASRVLPAVSERAISSSQSRPSGSLWSRSRPGGAMESSPFVALTPFSCSRLSSPVRHQETRKPTAGPVGFLVVRSCRAARAVLSE